MTGCPSPRTSVWGRESRRWGLLDRSASHRRAGAALARLGVEIDPSCLVEDLSIGRQQMVEIAKAVDAEADVLIMDEPTSSLSLAESEALFQLIEELAAVGTSVVYISHRLSEVERLADRALVLRDGEVAGELHGESIEHARLVELMVGREIDQFFAREPAHAGEGAEVLLRLVGLRTRAHPEHAASLEVRAGEVVGIAGLVGAGRSELMRALALVEPPVGGAIEVAGHELPAENGSPVNALSAGLAFVPEDRKTEGLFLDASVRDNLSIARLRRDARYGFVDGAAVDRLVEGAIQQTGIKTPDPAGAVSQLSGGNQQKVLLGRAFATHPAGPVPRRADSRRRHRSQSRDLLSRGRPREGGGRGSLRLQRDGGDPRSERPVPRHARGAHRRRAGPVGAERGGRDAPRHGRSLMKKIFGILGLFVFVCLATAIASEFFLTAFNIENLLRRSALFGILSIGAAFVIITGGIDLSIGSMVCLVGVMTPYLLVEQGLSVGLAVPLLLLLSCTLGAIHGLLITRLGLQPFLVTLCGLLLYRGIARGITADQTQGFRGDFGGLRSLGNGRLPVPGLDGFAVPAPLLILVLAGAAAALFLGRTVWGRWLFAIGQNETAAHYSAIPTARMTILAYVVCSGLAGLGGLLFVLDVGSAQPVDFGNFYELYAIAAAVLGGCSLRGGEGSILGVCIGAAVMQVLRNSITLIDAIPDNVEYAVIGAVILGGVITDEVVKRWVARRSEAARGA